jgi:hypothetical protein
MSSEEIAVRVAHLSKLYEIYHRPLDRLKQSIYPRIVGKYLRLLYAPDDRRNGIREEIRSLPWNSNRPESITLPRAQAEAPSYNIHAAEAEIEEFFDPNLVPQSTLAYESQGAHIESPKIFTLAGDRVNCLKRGKTYRYRYKVRFDKAAANVRFGMLIQPRPVWNWAVLCPRSRPTRLFLTSRPVHWSTWHSVLLACSIRARIFSIQACAGSRIEKKVLFIARWTFACSGSCLLARN